MDGDRDGSPLFDYRTFHRQVMGPSNEKKGVNGVLRWHWSKAVGLTGIVGMMTVGFGLPSWAATKAPILANVAVSTATVENEVAPTALGINTSIADGNLYSQGVPARIESLGIQLLRWPGGSIADTFDWSTEEFALQDFAQLMQQVHSQAVVTVNYGSGTPAQAAAEVRYANVTNHYGIQYWEIGNEQYGDGEYQHNAWEENLWPSKSPHAYAENSLKFIQAMRQVDPHIDIGVVATIPGQWPSGLKPYWDRTILPIVAKHINFVVLHFYPSDSVQSNSALLQDTNSIAQSMNTMKAYLKKYAGANAKHIKIFVDETNSSSTSSQETISLANALFLAKDYNDWLKDGASNVSWWDLQTSLPSYSRTTPGFGVISAGLPGQSPINAPYPTYFGYRLVHFLAQPGDSYVAATSSQPFLASYAVTDANGGIGLMLVNTSPSETYNTRYQGLTNRDGEKATVRYYGIGSSKLTTTSMTWNGTVASPPYSITEISMGPRH